MARRMAIAMTALAMAFATAAYAEEDDGRAREDRIADLERKLELMTEEVSRLRTQVGVPEEPELKSVYGFGPAASKIYGQERGLSLGGYGEGKYTAFVDDKGDKSNTTDLIRLVMYAGYKFTDNIVFNSEFEFEHAGSGGGGSVSVELASLDFFWKDELNFRTGLLLAPVGFINEIHEPPFFYGVERPETEKVIIPTTWREVGAGIFGQLGESLDYRIYAMTSLDASGFSSSGIRGGRQKGSRAISEDFSMIARFDWRPDFVEGLLLGGAVSVGNTGHEQSGPGGDLPNALMSLTELHAQYRVGNFHSRALFAYTHLSDTPDLNAALGNGAGDLIARQMLGGYVEFAYDIWPLIFGETTKSFRPFVRVEYVDPQFEVAGTSGNRNKANWVYTPGINYYPHPNVVLKVEYRNFEPRSGSRADEVSLGMGYAF